MGSVYCCENGITFTTQLVDPDLEVKIATESFERYIEVAKKCLAEKGRDSDLTPGVEFSEIMIPIGR
ncbi:hypothetical protein K1719_017583 [Acacia pycnantha]|nr:hypothetical protein K1719_017583 [Acacia pycnantha]